MWQRGCPFATLRSTTRQRSRQARRSVYRLRGSRTLPCRARCRARFRHSAGYRYRESQHAGHGTHLAAVAVKVEDVARLVTVVAAACTQLVHAANADTRTLTARSAERFALARRLGGAALAGATHGRSRPGKPRWAGRQTCPLGRRYAR